MLEHAKFRPQGSSRCWEYQSPVITPKTHIHTPLQAQKLLPSYPLQQHLSKSFLMLLFLTRFSNRYMFQFECVCTCVGWERVPRLFATWRWSLYPSRAHSVLWIFSWSHRKMTSFITDNDGRSHNTAIMRFLVALCVSSQQSCGIVGSLWSWWLSPQRGSRRLSVVTWGMSRPVAQPHPPRFPSKLYIDWLDKRNWVLA